MSNTPATNDSQPPGDPTTPKGGAWSSDDVFKLLEELLEARRNRELLNPADKTANVVFDTIADTFKTLHPSKHKIWNQKRVRNKHDDLAGIYKQWVAASKYSGCHADRMTGKLEYDSKEQENLILRYGPYMAKAFKKGLPCHENFHMDHYDEVFSNVIPTGNGIGELHDVVAPSPVADEQEEDVAAYGSYESDSDFTADEEPNGNDMEDTLVPKSIPSSRTRKRKTSTNPAASSKRSGAQKRVEARGRSKRSGRVGTYEEFTGILDELRAKKRSRHDDEQRNKKEQPTLAMAIEDVPQFAEECCAERGTSVVEWLVRDPINNPVVWFALGDNGSRLALLQKLGISLLD
ncbi:hypothetical protein E4U44_008653 [Claviceps purpurea]|nr:hypothetical protein E4U44_008653 [Claviceps purpurea]